MPDAKDTSKAVKAEKSPPIEEIGVADRLTDDLEPGDDSAESDKDG